MSYALESLKEIREKVQKMREEGEGDLRSVLHELDKAIKYCEDDENS